MTVDLTDLRIKIFADGANRTDFERLVQVPYIRGFTTNPTLMRNAGVSDYWAFAREVQPMVGDKPISFEVIADDFAEIERQARALAELGDNVYVKIPVMNTRREPSYELVKKLTGDGLRLNVTAVMNLEQVQALAAALEGGAPSVVSVFAGRIADTGRDPIPIMKEAKEILSSESQIELLWASPRELLNLFQAEEAGSDIITIQPSIIAKFKSIGYDLTDFSKDTVKMFHDDAVASGFSI